MNTQWRRWYAAFVMTALCLTSVAAAAGSKLDEGLLDPAWFGSELAFKKTDEIDYLWVRDGFSLDGQKIHLREWDDPQALGKKRKSKDTARAYELTDRMPSLLRGALVASLEDKAEVSKDEGTLELVGRFVDVNAGSNAAKWLVGAGAGSASATWDMKLVEKESGEVVLAIHHRAISGTTMSDIDDKIVKWLEDGLEDAVRRGVASVYAGGKTPKK